MASIPQVTVLMPVYNGGFFLQRILDSLERQTFQDFEILVVDDGSSDETPEILLSTKNPKIRIFRKEHEGLTAALNFGLEHARGNFIARQDADDYPKKERLEKQFFFLKHHPEVIMVGSSYYISDLDLNILSTVRMPANDLKIKWYGIFQNPFAHSSVMFRKDIIHQNGGYSTDRNALYVEDFELWTRLLRKNYRFENLHKPLIFHSIHPYSISEKKKTEQNEKYHHLVDSSLDFFGVNHGINTRIREVIWLLQVGSGQPVLSSEMEQALDCLDKLLVDFANYYHLTPKQEKLVKNYMNNRTAATLVHSTLSQLRCHQTIDVNQLMSIAMRLDPKTVFSSNFWRVKIKPYQNA
jgi:glycosyltransferase involved in cell wall biosynthesis